MTATLPSRRDALKLALALALPAAPAAAAAPPADVRFLDSDEAAAALTDGPDAAYFERMNLREIRARMQTPLEGMTTAEARSALRRFYAAQAQSFDDDEKAAIRGIVDRMQPQLAARAPLYARTPWSFVKLSSQAEGGLPHTRGAHVVLPADAVEHWTGRDREARKAGRLAAATFGAGLLVHEQTHVLQRADPERFEPLYIQALGFIRLPEAPTTAWLAQHLVQNPDAPDLAWAFPLERIGGRGWIMPTTVLRDVPAPRMPQDFEVVAVPVAPRNGRWKVLDDSDAPRFKPLSKVPGYERFFPYAEEAIHPNEIAAVALSHWILEEDPRLARRPRIEAVARWARTALA
jgi:hypothetical protein